MNVQLDRSGSVKELSAMLLEMEQNEAVQGIMILACDANGFIPDDVDPLLKALQKPVWGGVFPQILHEKENLETGTIVVGIHHAVKTLIIRDIGDVNRDLEEDLEAFEETPLEGRTMFVFVDGLSTGVAAVKDSLFNCLGLQSNYLGGGAGSLSFEQKPCLFTGEGLLEDGAVLALAEMKSGVGVAHGWQPVSEPLKITESDRNRIVSINWRPAFQVYRETVEKLANISFDDQAFFDIAKGYPFGIIKMADEMVVRDPIEVNEAGEMICVGEVPVNSFVYILRGDRNTLIKGAAEALQLARDSAGTPLTETHTFFIDCISRVLFLEDDFHREMETVYQGGILVGALTLGEMANTGKSYLEFYNKTSVVGLLEA